MAQLRDVRVTPVTVPMVAPLRWSMGVETGTTRSIIEIETSEGIVGLGETYGGAGTVRVIEWLKPLLIGCEIDQLEQLSRKLQMFRISYETFVPLHVVGGLEIAFLDALGKSIGQSVSQLLGGQFRSHIPCSAYMFFTKPGGREQRPIDNPEAIVDASIEQMERFGFKTVKIKGGVLSPDQELRVLQSLRHRYPELRLRFDPNAAWSIETSLRYLYAFQELGLEFVEDPVDGIEGMSRVRRDIPIPLATNMCVITFAHIPLAVRTNAVDIILADVHYWGGLRANLKLAAIAETFQLGLGIHSDRELGISTAAQLHLAAALPSLPYAMDSHYIWQTDDVITTPFVFHEGGLMVPEGPGLGVELDRKKLEYYHQQYLTIGDVVEFGDPDRPQWVPVLPLF